MIKEHFYTATDDLSPEHLKGKVIIMQYIFDDNQVDLQYKLKSIELALDHIITVCKHHKNLAFDVEESFYDKELYELDPEGFHENCLEIFKDVSEDTVDSIKSLALDAKEDIRKLNSDFNWYAKPF